MRRTLRIADCILCKLMRVKIKKKDEFLECENFSSITFDDYVKKMHNYTKNQLRTIYNVLFQKDCTCDMVWAKYQISYELARQMYIKSGNLAALEKGSQFRKAYEGTMACDANATGETLRSLIPYEIKHNNENVQESIMKKENKIKAIKKAAAVKAANRIGLTMKKSVVETWACLFRDNVKRKWTDDKLSEFMHQEFPDVKNKTFDQVGVCRSSYNSGRLTKGVKPEIRSVAYNEQGQELGRRAKAATPVKTAESEPESTNKAPAKPKRTLKAKRPALRKTSAVAA